MGTINSKSLLEISPEREKIIIEDRETLIDTLAEIEILLPTNPRLQATYDDGKQALESLNAMYNILVKRKPSISNSGKK